VQSNLNKLTLNLFYLYISNFLAILKKFFSFPLFHVAYALQKTFIMIIIKKKHFLFSNNSDNAAGCADFN